MDDDGYHYTGYELEISTFITGYNWNQNIIDVAEYWLL